ncbi:hypothetical protein RB595_004179 [Gaeumannomyces hyphopodioides]
MFQVKVRLAGIVYLHSIAESRITGSAMKNLRMFKQLCGDGALERVALGTTMWGHILEEVSKRWEGGLKIERAFWADLIEKDSVMLRHGDDEHSARPVGLKIQTEMAGGKSLYQTSAGLEVEAERERLMAKHKDEMRILQAEWEEAQKARDTEAKKELESLKANLEAKMRREREDSQRMPATVE